MRPTAVVLALLFFQGLFVHAGEPAGELETRPGAAPAPSRQPLGASGAETGSAPSSPVGQQAALVVLSVPDGAQIRLDGLLLPHRTPARIELQGPPRPRSIRLDRKGYRTWRITTSLARGEVRTVTAHMRGNGGHMQLHTEPWTIVFIDGKVVGATPLFTDEIQEGTYRVRMVNEEFGIDCVENVSILTGERKKIFKKFFGTLEIATLQGMDTYLNGECLPRSEASIVRKLPCGYHQVRRVSGGNRSESLMNVLLREGERTRVP